MFLVPEKIIFLATLHANCRTDDMQCSASNERQSQAAFNSAEKLWNNIFISLHYKTAVCVQKCVFALIVNLCRSESEFWVDSGMSAATGAALAAGLGSSRPPRRPPEAGATAQGDGKCLMSSRIHYHFIQKTFFSRTIHNYWNIFISYNITILRLGIFVSLE